MFGVAGGTTASNKGSSGSRYCKRYNHSIGCHQGRQRRNGRCCHYLMKTTHQRSIDDNDRSSSCIGLSGTLIVGLLGFELTVVVCFLTTARAIANSRIAVEKSPLYIIAIALSFIATICCRYVMRLEGGISFRMPKRKAQFFMRRW